MEIIDISKATVAEAAPVAEEVAVEAAVEETPQA